MILMNFWPLYQFLWTLFFITEFLIGFWCIFMFFGFIIPLWLTEGLREYFGKSKPFNPEDIQRKPVTEQEGVTVLYNQPKGEGPYLHHTTASEHH